MNSYMATKQYICNYVTKKKTWPDVTISNDALLASVFAHRRGHNPTSTKVRRVGNIQLSDYQYVTINKNKEFEMYADFNGLIKDKTITQLRSDVMDQARGEERLSRKDYYDKTKLLLNHFLEIGLFINFFRYI